MISTSSSPSVVKRCPDRADHAVQHAGRGNDIGPALGMADRDPVHQFERGIVEEVHAAPGLADDPAVPVIGVFAGTDIGDDNHLRDFCLDPADCLLDNAVRDHTQNRLPASLSFGMPKSRTARIPCFQRSCGNRRDPADRVPELAGHRLDRARCCQVLVHKKRGDQIIFRERDLTQERLDIP